jgi:cold shock CspA family protein
MDETTTRERGTVKSWLGARGFGFVVTDTGAVLFLHRSHIRCGTPRPGAACTFTRTPSTGRNDYAVNVTIQD